jgi:phosphatidylinositol alpha-1,6-mannosyltransferase
VARKTLFLTLRVFSAMGGIERVCRIFGKALCELNGEEQETLQVYSMYDTQVEIDESYFPAPLFKAFGTKRNRFIAESIRTGIKSEVVVISHINLMPVAFCIKLFSPKTKLILLAHGIEVWKSFSLFNKFMLKRFDLILPVSRFTRDKMILLNSLDRHKFSVLNNCLDPYLPVAISGSKDPDLLKKYGFKQDDIVLMTISRLSSKEMYKNCDKVLATIQLLLPEYPQLKYLLIGAYDKDEKIRIDNMSRQLGVDKAVVITGFIPDSEFSQHYNLSDAFIMLSEREGFGIVFIEAMFYGIPVIGADCGGIPDALVDGELGILVDPGNINEVASAVKKIITGKDKCIPSHTKVMDHFSYDSYKEKLAQIIATV